jgi:hypothetical protein
VAREEDAPVQDKLKVNLVAGIWIYDKLGRRQTLGFRQLPFQFRVFLLRSTDCIRLVQGHTALQGDVLVQLIMYRLLFL